MNFSFSPKEIIMAQNKYLSAAQIMKQFETQVPNQEFGMDKDISFGKN